MILGHIDNFAVESQLYAASLQRGLQYLRNTDFSKLEDGKQAIDGEEMFAVISQYVPEPKEIRRAEAHRKYIDIQYIISGEEVIGYANLSKSAIVSEDLLVEKDLIFYSDVRTEAELKVSQGMYAIFFPWDIHRPCCMSQPGITVRKVVVKIKL